MREARKIEQSHNPNYLKAKTKKNQNATRNNIDDIPIAELALDVPLKITCKKLNHIFFILHKV